MNTFAYILFIMLIIGFLGFGYYLIDKSNENLPNS
jgi:hypothetical protein